MQALRPKKRDKKDPPERVEGSFQGAVQDLVVVPGLWCTEGLAAEEGKIRLREVRQDQLPGAQSLVFQLQLSISGIVAVLAVAQDRAADAGHMGADLMGAPGDQADLEQSQAAGDGQGLVLGLHLFGAGQLFAYDLRP